VPSLYLRLDAYAKTMELSIYAHESNASWNLGAFEFGFISGKEWDRMDKVCRPSLSSVVVSILLNQLSKFEVEVSPHGSAPAAHLFI
jgi:hypothetical protein